MQFVEQLKTQGLVKGDFKLLDASRIDLPTRCRPESSAAWIQRMPGPVHEIFSDNHLVHLLSPVRRALHDSPEIPVPRVHSLTGHYAKVLLRMHDAGMLQWSVIENEDPQYTELADALVMTSFAVLKDETRDRLISWPRVQNLYMPDPPHTALPNPGHFSKIRTPRDSALSGFYSDIENMFHNIRMPPHLAAFFPMKEIPFGSLPGPLQRSLRNTLGYQPRQAARLRPLQCTLPMGFKWAVFISHTFVQSCYMEALNVFLSTLNHFGTTFSLPRILLLHQASGIVKLNTFSVLVLHIIDDLNFVFVDWPDDLVSNFQASLTSLLSRNFLPLHKEKSSPTGVIERDVLPFIGWIWYLRRGILRPKHDKLLTASSAVLNICQGTLTEHSVRSAVGRLIWNCLGCRPLLSILYRTFHYLQDVSKWNKSLERSVKRELTMTSRLVLFSHIKLYRRQWTRVIAIDACTSGGAVVYTDVAEKCLDELLYLAYKYDSRPFTALPPYREKASTEALEFIQTFVKKHIWKTAFVHHWRRPEHINALEAHTAILALNWAVSFPISGFRILILSDSMVTIDAFRKGRSSSASMCLPCRQYAALSLAHDLDVSFMHIPSELNPADGPSRSRALVGLP